MSAKLYQELAKRSGKNSDQREALDNYERIIKRFPDSRYRQKAAREARTLSATTGTKTTDSKKTSKTTRNIDGKDKYLNAEACYNSLQQNSGKMKYRHNWLQCIEKFQSIYHDNPTGPWAAASLYMSAKLYEGLYQYSKRKSDLQAAYDVYSQIIDEFQDSRYNVKASLLIDRMPEFVKRESTTQGDAIAQQIESNSKTPSPVLHSSTVMVDNLRFWSNPNYTRVVIDTSGETSYDHHLLKKDPSINKPQRLYIDLSNSRLGENIKKTIPINDDLLSDARAGQYTNNSVRVVVDIKSFKSYKIFSLKDPFRIVIDVWGIAGQKSDPKQSPMASSKKSGKLPSSSLAKQLALGVSRIVIDPGHGGRDHGAPGYLKGVHEKDIVLQIARRLAKKVRKELGYEVIMTRNSDRFLTLEERTAIANTKNADLFLSIHTNSHRDRRAYGIETYFLNLATDDEAIRVAAIENATSTKNISDLQTILYDLMQNAKINESSRLASHVQGRMVGYLKQKRYSRIKDKGVKQAPFYVLLGAQMPAILVETSFISNPRECKRLLDPKYQERLCDGIIKGIRGYVKETIPTAFFKDRPDLRPQS
ncbi:MAG: N-acetylmuramoyl-L-alanine amidase [Desulfobacterales bacterium]